jgi:hypothetical protein
MTLPYMEQDNIFKGLTPALTDIDTAGTRQWWNPPNVTSNPDWALATTRIPSLVCPSDDPYSQVTGVFICLDLSNYTLTGGYWPNPTGEPLGRTNYVGNGGCIGQCYVDAFYHKWMGPFYNRSKTTMGQLIDGTSNILLFGEALGGLHGPRNGTKTRNWSFAWAGCGNLATAWGVGPNPAGTENGGEWYKFSSYHPSIVQFCFADGSVRSVKHQVGHVWWTNVPFVDASGMKDQIYVSDPNVGQ